MTLENNINTQIAYNDYDGAIEHANNDDEYEENENIGILIVDGMLNNIFNNVYMKLHAYIKSCNGSIDGSSYENYMLQLLRECRAIDELYAFLDSIGIYTLYSILRKYKDQYEHKICKMEADKSSQSNIYTTLECICFKMGYIKQIINMRLAYCES